MIGRIRKYMGGGAKLALALLAAVVVVSVGYGTWETMAFTGNGLHDVPGFPNPAGTHWMQAQAPTIGDLDVTLEEPLGTTIVMELHVADGACQRTSHYLPEHTQPYYGFFAGVTNYGSGTAKAWLADAANVAKIPSCTGS